MAASGCFATVDLLLAERLPVAGADVQYAAIRKSYAERLVCIREQPSGEYSVNGHKKIKPFERMRNAT